MKGLLASISSIGLLAVLACGLSSCGSERLISQSEAEKRLTVLKAVHAGSSFVWPSSEIHYSIASTQVETHAPTSFSPAYYQTIVLSESSDYVADPFSLSIKSSSSGSFSKYPTVSDLEYTLESGVYYSAKNGGPKQETSADAIASQIDSVTAYVAQPCSSAVDTLLGIYSNIEEKDPLTKVSLSQAFAIGDDGLRIELAGDCVDREAFALQISKSSADYPWDSKTGF